jgi:carotenoid cleavage dioxygenase
VGEGCATSEPIFVPRSSSAPEGDGFLLAYVYDANRAASHLMMLDAQNLAQGPLAKAMLDHRVPYGFHGNWRDNNG